MTESREFLKKPQMVRLNWYESNEYLAGYISSLDGGAHLDGLIYDLGHYGRGFDDFGKKNDIIIQCNKAKFVDPPSYRGQRLEAIMKLKSFLKTIVKEIEDYPKEQGSLDRELERFNRVISLVNENKLITLRFSPDDRGYRILESINDSF